jgi:hypothetical protein
MAIKKYTIKEAPKASSTELTLFQDTDSKRIYYKDDKGRLVPVTGTQNIDDAQAQIDRVETTASGNIDTTAFQKAIGRNACTVVYLGNSVTEGINAQMEGYNTWVQEFQRQLTTKYNSISFSYYNYGLGSRNITMLDNTDFKGVGSPDPGDGTGFYRAVDTLVWQRASTIGKSWLDHAKDERPDMVVMEFGLNSNLTEANFKTTYQSVIDKIQAWDKVPTIVLMTEMFPTETADPQLDLIGMIRRYNDAIRELCSENRCGLIDVGRQFDLLRSGRDSIIKQEFPLTVNGLTQIVGAAPDAITYNRLDEATNSVVYAWEKDEAYNCTMTGNYIPKTTASILQMGIRFKKSQSEAWSAGVAVQVLDASCKIWENGSTVQTDLHSAITATNTHTFEITVIEDTITVKIDAATISTYTISDKKDVGNIAYGVKDADTTSVSIYVDEGILITETAKYTNNELLGNKTAAEYNGGDVRDGGNKLNHPSRIGLREGFYPIIREFINNL